MIGIPWPLNEAWKTNRGGAWLHIDQHPISRSGRQCIQGLVNLLPTTPATGGNVLIPGSHKNFEKIPEIYPERLGRLPIDLDHFRFPSDDPLLAGTTPIICHLEAGDLLLWDSRVIHCSGGGAEAPKAEAKLMRAISLTCMMPKHLTSPDVIEARKDAVEKVISTTNWTDQLINADRFPPILAEPNPERFHRPDPPKLNDAQKLLVGY